MSTDWTGCARGWTATMPRRAMSSAWARSANASSSGLVPDAVASSSDVKLPRRQAPSSSRRPATRDAESRDCAAQAW